MDLLLRRIHSKRPPVTREVIIPTKLVLRGSCAAPKGMEGKDGAERERHGFSGQALKSLP